MAKQPIKSTPPVPGPGFIKHKGSIFSISQILAIKPVKPFLDKFDKRTLYTHIMLLRGSLNDEGKETTDRVFLMEGAVELIERAMRVVDVTPGNATSAPSTIPTQSNKTDVADREDLRLPRFNVYACDDDDDADEAPF